MRLRYSLRLPEITELATKAVICLPLLLVLLHSLIAKGSSAKSLHSTHKSAPPFPNTAIMVLGNLEMGSKDTD